MSVNTKATRVLVAMLVLVVFFVLVSVGRIQARPLLGRDVYRRNFVVSDAKDTKSPLDIRSLAGSSRSSGDLTYTISTYGPLQPRMLRRAKHRFISLAFDFNRDHRRFPIALYIYSKRN